MLIIEVQKGFCNRIRTIFSYNEYAKSIKQTLHVLWLKDEHCPGFYLDYFKPIPNVIFLNDKNSNQDIFYTGCGWHPKYPPYQYIGDSDKVPNLFKNLKLKDSINMIIKNKIKILENNYIALHIRRTDHTNLAKRNNKYTSDQEFMAFINRNKNINIYIASDNKETYNKFKNLYPNRIKFDYHFSNNNERRKTSLQDAIIDLFMCVYSNKFLGSNYSSYSDTIINLKKNIKT